MSPGKQKSNSWKSDTIKWEKDSRNLDRSVNAYNKNIYIFDNIE